MNNNFFPGPRFAGGVLEKRATSRPLGMTRYVPPIRSLSKAAARSETAVRTARRRIAHRSPGAARSYKRARPAPEWNVPTTGARASSVAHNAVEGAGGGGAGTPRGTHDGPP